MITHVCHFACACHARGPQVWYPSTPCICIYIYWGVGVSRTEEGVRSEWLVIIIPHLEYILLFIIDVIAF